MAFYHQNRQTVIIATICLIVVIVVAFYVYNPFGMSTKEVNRPSIDTTTLASSSKPLDISNTDWQKDFYSVSSSTNGSYVGDTKRASSTAPLTNTDIMGRELLANYLQLQKTGQTSNKDAVTFVANQLVDNAMSRMATAAVYYSTDINISKKYDVASLTSYSNGLSKILDTSMPKKNEVYVVTDVADTGDMSLLKNIDPIIDGYKQTLQSLLSIPVPEPLSPYHLMLVNGVSMQFFNAQQLRKISSDPLSGLAAVNQEVPAMEQTSGALDQIKSHLLDKGIVFVY